MGGVVKFTLDADDAKAVGAFMRVVDAQKKTERELKKISKAGKQTTSTMGGLGKSIMGLTGGLIGAAGLKMAIGALTGGMEKISKKTIQFEDEITELLALGENVKNIEAIKNAVLDMSGAFGMSRKEIIGGMFIAQSALSDYSKKIQREINNQAIVIKKVYGVEMPDAMKLLSKGFAIYGKELKDIGPIAGKLAETGEQSVLNMKELAAYIPNVLAVAKPLGYSLEDVGAAFMTISGQMGRVETMATGTRNIFLQMNKAIKAGIPITGDIIQDLKTLSEVPATKIMDIFGRESFAAIAGLMGKLDEFIKKRKSLEEIKVGKEAKYVERLKDEAFRYSEIAKSIKMINENLIISGKHIITTGRVTQQMQLTETGLREGMGPWVATFGQLAKPLAWMMTVMNQIEEAEFGLGRFREGPQLPGFEGRFLKRGRKTVVETGERAGGLATILAGQQRERWGMGPATGAGEGADKLDIAAGKLDKAADKIIAASETTDKAMSNISRGITSRN